MPWAVKVSGKSGNPTLVDAEHKIVCEFLDGEDSTARYVASLVNLQGAGLLPGATGAPERPTGAFVEAREDLKAKTRVPVGRWWSAAPLDMTAVTLVMIETREHALANLAIHECVKRAKFGDVLIFTDMPAAFDDFNARIVRVPDWPEKLGWSRCLWQEVAPLLRTSHMLAIQWDSWIIDPCMWSDEWLRYDYIGAPWWYQDGKNVGNGGFSLRSTALMRHIVKHLDKYPCTTALDDDLLCRGYRLELMKEGFEWAPEEVAQDFAFECVRKNALASHFGFHACFNFGLVLEPEALLERARLMANSPYIRKAQHMWPNFLQANPGIEEKLAG